MTPLVALSRSSRSGGPEGLRDRATQRLQRDRGRHLAAVRSGGSRQVVAAAAEVALELAGDRVAVGLGEVDLGGALLERPHVLDDLVVLAGHLVDGLDPVLGLLGQRAQRHRELEDLLDPLQQGDGRARRRRLRHVVRDGGPEADRRQARPARRRPGRRRGCRSAPRSGRSPARRRARTRRRRPSRSPGSGRVCGVSASRAPRATTIWHVELAQQRRSARRRTPRQRMLGSMPADEDDVAVAARRAGHRDARRGPLDPPADAAHQRDRRPVDLEVVVVLGVERGQRLGVPDQLQVLDARPSRRPRRRSSPRTRRPPTGRSAGAGPQGADVGSITPPSLRRSR